MMYVGCPELLRRRRPWGSDGGAGAGSSRQAPSVRSAHDAIGAVAWCSRRVLSNISRYPRQQPRRRASRPPARRRVICWQSIRGISPYGAGSPLGSDFRTLDGKILLLGSDHDEVTFLHHVEHIVDFPDKKISAFQSPVRRATARVVWRDVEEVNTAGDGAHANWPDRFFAQIVDGYLESSGQSRQPASATPLAISCQLATFTILPHPLMQETASSEI